MVARDELHQPPRKNTCAVELAEVRQHLIQRRHAARGGVAAAAGHPGTAKRRGVFFFQRLLFSVRARFVGGRGTRMLRIGHADKNIVSEAQRLDNALPQKIAIVDAAYRFDQCRSHPQR